MAVTIEVPVERLAVNGYTDPALPIGQWKAQPSIVGDASGGTHTLLVIFAEVTAARNEQLYNIEYMSLRANADDSIAGIFNITNMLHSGSWAYNIIANGTAVGVGAVAMTMRTLHLPIWLGGQDTAPAQARLETVTVNITGVTQRLTIGGYVWGSRSILAEGGPQRPARALWG